MTVTSRVWAYAAYKVWTYAAYKVWASPEELSHGDASLVEHGVDELRQVLPDVGDVYGHVLSHLQDLLEPMMKTHNQVKTLLIAYTHALTWTLLNYFL